MKETFILFVTSRFWPRYGRQPHYCQLTRFGELIVVEEPVKILSSEFLSNPIRTLLDYFKISKRNRDLEKNLKILRPILLFSSKLKNSFPSLGSIDHLLLMFQLRKMLTSKNYAFFLLTNRIQEWLIKKRRKTFYYLDIDDEWSMINYDESKRTGIEKDMRRLVRKVDLSTTVSIQLLKKYDFENKVFFLPNAVDTNHYTPNFDNTERVKEKRIEQLLVDVEFLKDHKDDPKRYSTNLKKMNEFKKPIVGSISGLAGNWSDFAFISKVEKELPSHFNMVSSGNVHPPTNSKFIREYEEYLSKQRMSYLGFLDYSVLPDFLKFLDVGLVMHRMDEFNTHSAPNKIWAYLAMGLPVVSTDFLTEPDKEIYEGLVNFAKTPEEYVNYIVEEYQSDNLEKKKKRRELAVKYSTANRIEKLYNMLIYKAGIK